MASQMGQDRLKVVLKWDVCEKVYGIRLKRLRVMHRINIENIQLPHLDCAEVCVSRRAAAADNIDNLVRRARVGRKCVVLVVAIQVSAMVPPTNLKGNISLTGINWLKILVIRVRVMLVFGQVFGFYRQTAFIESL